jgi:hypothetical protein
MPETSTAAISLPRQRTRDGRASAPPASPPSPSRPRRRIEPLVAVAFLITAVVLTGGLWIDPAGRVIAANSADQFFFEWVLTWTAHALAHGADPFFTSAMNAPLGVNIAANTGITLAGVVLTPVTLLAGASASFLVTLTVNLAATAYAWFWFFDRHTARSRGASIVAGALCGFGPGMMAHANSHLNFTAQFLIPILLWRLMRLCRTGSIRDGVIAGLLATAQYSLGAELLFFTGTGVAVYAVAVAWQRPRIARRIARRIAGPLGAGILVAACLLAFPLWMQFFGPQTYHGTGFADLNVNENLLAFGAYGHQSLAGALGAWAKLSLNVAEENTFFGVVLLILVVATMVRMWRNGPAEGAVTIRALSITGLVIVVLSLGSRPRFARWTIHVDLPWAALSHLPFFDSALPGRFALLLTPIVAYLLAVEIDQVRDRWRALPEARRRNRLLRRAALVGVLAVGPILPVPLDVATRSPLPRFFTSGEWRQWVPDGRTVVTVPPSTTASPDGQRWQTATDFGFAIDGGYFLGPGTDGRSHVGPVPTPTYTLLKEVSSTGVTRPVTDADRSRADADLRFWNAGLIVLPDPRDGVGDAWSQYYPAVRSTAIALFGPGRHVDDVTLWPVPR